MQNVFKPGIGSKVNTVAICIILGSCETWQKMQIPGSVGTERRREESQNLWQTLTITGRTHPVHRWRDEVEPVWVGGAEVEQDGPDLFQNRIDAMRNRRRAIGPCQEVRETSDDNDVDIGSDLGQGLRKDAEMTARENLGSLQAWMSTDTGPVDVAIDVGVPKKTKHTNFRWSCR